MEKGQAVVLQDANLGKAFLDIETRPLSFTAEELEKIRQTQLYQNISDEYPIDILLITCTFVAMNRNYATTRQRLKKRYKVLLNKQTFNYIRLREPYLSIIKRFKDCLEERLQYIPLYSRQVRLKELQLALKDAKKIEDLPSRTKAIVEIVNAAQKMIEGKKVNVKSVSEHTFTLYNKVADAVRQIHQTNQTARGLVTRANGVTESVPVQ